ncbi:unnamed protein product [Moneuplotes crassus]|uniref:EF-hand domain-containing protein n=1 Tax=Euplotes crassus TaxID=5936 RepID=A0AAD1X8H4_EUPCR|nr:unnamed protein product [Moneuplotes crassus]
MAVSGKFVEMFEADLRFKVDSKCPSGQMEERYLVKSFQFFDFHRTGLIDFTQFYKTLERVGVILTKPNALKIFEQVVERVNSNSASPSSNSDLLDYRTYARQVYNPESYDSVVDNQVHKPLTTPVYETGYDVNTPSQSETYSQHGDAESSHQTPRIVRSGMKDPNTDTLEMILQELRKRVRVRGPNAYALLHRQFKIVDINQEGFVNKFELSKILREMDLNLLESQFMVLFDAYDLNKDGNLSYHQFLDELFGLQQQESPQEEIKMRESPPKHEIEQTPSPAKSEPVSETRSRPEPYPMPHADFHPKAQPGYNQELTAENVKKLDPISHTKPMYQEIGEKNYKENYTRSEASFDENRSYTSDSSFGFLPEQPKIIPKFQKILFRRLMDCIRPRGVKGLIGFSRQLNLYDTSKSGYLSQDEFKQAFSDYEIEMIDIDVEHLYNSFCHQEEGGKLNINEFLETFIQPMNKNRFSLVKKVWKHLDYQKEGRLPVGYVMDSYDASRHPDVTSFRKDQEEVDYEFRDYWQKKAHYSY